MPWRQLRRRVERVIDHGRRVEREPGVGPLVQPAPLGEGGKSLSCRRELKAGVCCNASSISCQHRGCHCSSPLEEKAAASGEERCRVAAAAAAVRSWAACQASSEVS